MLVNSPGIIYLIQDDYMTNTEVVLVARESQAKD